MNAKALKDNGQMSPGAAQGPSQSPLPGTRAGGGFLLEHEGAMRYFKAAVEGEELRENIEFKLLFAKLGLNYDTDVPRRIKDQLRADKNSK